MVPGEHPVVHAQYDVGQREIVVARCGQPFEREPPVVADVAGDATLKRGQTRHRLGGERREPGANRVERVARPGALNHGNRIGHQERIPSEPCRAGGAIQKQPIRQTLEPFAALHRIRSGRQLLDERRHVVSEPRSLIPDP